MTKEMVICNVSGDNCSAPAGYQVGGLGGGAALNTDRRKQVRCTSKRLKGGQGNDYRTRNQN